MNKLTWPAVGFLAVVGAVIVALAAVTDWDSTAIIAIAGILLGAGGGAAIAGGVAGKVEDLHTETKAQTEAIEGVAHQVNGELTARIQAGADRAATAVLDELRKQGVIK